MVVLVVALFLRLTWAVAQPRTAAGIDRLPDQREYLTLAENLLHRHRLELYDPRFGQTVRAYRLPGYPLAIAACGASVLAVRLAQAGLDTATVFGVYLLGRRMVGRPAAVVAAALMAVHPLYVYFAGLVLTETAFAAAVVWGMVALTRLAGGLARRARGVERHGRQARRLNGLLLATACFAVAAYLRPTAVVLGPALAFLANRQAAGAYHRKAALGVGLGIVVALAPWAYRNRQVLGSAVWTTTNDGVTLYDGFHDGATGGSDQAFLPTLLAQVPALRSMNEVDRSRDLARRARAWAVAHPAAVVVLAGRKLARGWSPVPLSDAFGRPLYRLAGGAFAVPFDLLVIAGLCRRRVSGKCLLICPAVVLTAVQVATVGSIRYRMPAEAPLAVLAGTGAVGLWEWVKRLRHATAGLHAAPPV